MRWTCCGCSWTRTSTARDSRSAAGGLGGGRRTQFTDGYVLDAVEIGGRPSSSPPITWSATRDAGPPADPAEGRTAARSGCASATTTPCPACSAGARPGRRPRTATSTTSPSGTRAWRSTTTSAAGTRCPTSGSEFYLEYGTFDYSVTVPADMIVAGSGELVNPDRGADAAQRARLAEARASDKTVMIRTADEAAAATAASDGDQDLALPHGRMPATSPSRPPARSSGTPPASICRTARRRWPSRSIRPRTAATAAWGRSTEYLKFAVEEFSRRWFPYPWPERHQRRRAGGRDGIPGPAVRQHATTRARPSSTSPSTRSVTATSR